MDKIVQVATNVRHNGTDYKKGDVIELDPSMAGLISEGLFAVVEGAKTVAEAQAMLGAQVVATPAEREEVVASQDTWGAQPDPKPEAEAPKAPVTDETKTEGDKEPTAPVTDGVAPVSPTVEGQPDANTTGTPGEGAPAAEDKKDGDDGITGNDL